MQPPPSPVQGRLVRLSPRSEWQHGQAQRQRGNTSGSRSRSSEVEWEARGKRVSSAIAPCPGAGHTSSRFETLMNILGASKAIEACGGKNERVTLPFLEFAQPRVDVAADLHKRKIRDAVRAAGLVDAGLVVPTREPPGSVCRTPSRARRRRHRAGHHVSGMAASVNRSSKRRRKVLQGSARRDQSVLPRGASSISLMKIPFASSEIPSVSGGGTKAWLLQSDRRWFG